MRSSRTRIFAVSAALMVSALVAACGGSSGKNSGYSSSGGGGSAAGKASSTFTIDSAVPPSTLDPAQGCGEYDLAAISNLYMRLTQYGTKPGPDGTTEIDAAHIKPWAAAGWKTSDAGKTYTFTLKPGLKFADGTPITAKDVAYSINYNDTAAACGLFFTEDGFSNPLLIKSMSTPNARTIAFHLSQADNNFPQAMAQPAAGILEPSIVSKHGGISKNLNKWMASHQAGASGPFEVQSYTPNQSLTLAANPNYSAGPKPASSKVQFTYVDSDSTLLLDAKSGQADAVLGLSPQSVASLKSDSNVTIAADPTPTSEQIGLPNNKAPFNNKLFREALTYAVPYQEIIKKAAFGYGTAYYGPLQPLLADYNPALSKARPYDLARAKQLIKQSGVKTPVTVNMVVQAGNSTDQQVATIAAGVWAQLGVKVNIQTESASAYINALEGHKVQSYVRLDGPGVLDPGYYLAYDMTCGVSFNLSAVCIPKADKLLQKARQTSSPTAKKAIYDEITRLWDADSPKIQVYDPAFLAVLKKGVTGYLYSHELDVRTWAFK